jgi:hypothetical protein
VTCRPVWRVFAEATFGLVVGYRSYSLLELANRRPGRMESLPSWAIDFATKRRFSSPIASFSRNESRNESSSSTEIEEGYLPTISNDACCLSVVGSTSDPVRATVTVNTRDRSAALLEKYLELITVVRGSRVHVNPEEVHGKWAYHVLRRFLFHWRSNFLPAEAAPSHKPKFSFEDLGNLLDVDNFVSYCGDFSIDEDFTLFVTQRAYFGIAPEGTAAADALLWTPGSATPLLLRPRQDDWTFRGLALVDIPHLDTLGHFSTGYSQPLRNWIRENKKTFVIY